MAADPQQAKPKRVLSFPCENLHEQNLRVEVYFPIEKTGSAAGFLFLKLHLRHVMI